MGTESRANESSSTFAMMWFPRVVARSDSFDVRVHGWVIGRRTPAHTKAVLALTRSGSSPAVCLAMATIPPTITLRRTSSPSAAVAEAAGTLGIVVSGIALRRVLMCACRRQRPPRGTWAYDATGYAFPSGHSTNAAMAASLLIAAAGAQRTAHTRGIPVVTGTATTYALAIGASRVYLGVHWPSDVIGGWLLGSGWAVLTRRHLNRGRSFSLLR